MTDIETQIKALNMLPELLTIPEDLKESSFLLEALRDAAQSLVGYEKNEQAADRALARCKELETSYASITRLNSNDVCELAMEWLDMNNPDPDKVGDIAERMGMGWDESTEEFLDFDNILLKVRHRHEVYKLQSEIFQLKDKLGILNPQP